ncbi:Hypp2833 [Branchiostoma lanceolatum]|uniref:Hypp2833 protein n=1 Tax=Branchiostoma lanceolatum TaxID=7740 RepID=A0A8K0ERV9_BRALA|nr:Hypp2833 [Branchiostoma lanceolatum]
MAFPTQEEKTARPSGAIHWACSPKKDGREMSAGVYQRGNNRHDHPPEMHTATNFRIQAKVRQRGVENLFRSAGQIAEEVVVMEADVHVRMVNKRRPDLRPKDPTTLDFELEEQHLPDGLFRADIRFDGHRRQVLASARQLKLLAEANTWYMDATFKVVRTEILRRLPENPKLKAFVMDFEQGTWQAFVQHSWEHQKAGATRRQYMKEPGTQVEEGSSVFDSVRANLVIWIEADPEFPSRQKAAKEALTKAMKVLAREESSHATTFSSLLDFSKGYLNQEGNANYRIALEEERRKTREEESAKAQKKVISFVKQGQKVVPGTKSKPTGGILNKGQWKMSVDLDTRLCFPRHICETTLRPDLVLWSEEAKAVIIVELTVPWEENIQAAFERKKLKYLNLKEQCEMKGWRTLLYPVEVGCRGFAGTSLARLYRDLAVGKKVMKRMAEEVEKSQVSNGSCLQLADESSARRAGVIKADLEDNSHPAARSKHPNQNQHVSLALVQLERTDA